MTKKYHVGVIVTSIISTLLMFGPVVVFVLMGWNVSDDSGRYILSISLILTLFLTFINAVFKWHFRSIIWIFLLAIYYCIKDASMLILVFGICQLVDELIVSPLLRFFKQKYSINKELDKRL